MDTAFWSLLDQMVASARLVIDRPKGTAHPRYPDMIYPYDYGYLEGTTAADGGGVDVWLGSLPERRVTGVIVTVDVLKKDAELKILIGCTPDEAGKIVERHNSYSQGGLLVMR